jgi:hypothetical protein
LKNARGNQIGGTERIIPKYLGTRNTPFKTQETKKIETTRYNEIPNYLKNNNVKDDPLVEFKVNPSLLNVKKPMNQEIYPANYVPIQNKILPQDFPYVHGIHNMLPYSFVPNNVPVIKNYHISMPNPAGDHLKLADLYEDMLPQSDNNFKNTSLTLEERLITYNYVRSILVKIGDGEDIEISGKIGSTTNRKNLLSYLKLLDLNPYHDSKITKNPYKSPTDKMLMYRSCYPIRFDAAKKNVTCSKYSIGLNLRIYEMSVLEYNAKKIFSQKQIGTGIELQDVKKSKYNLWREISFYEFVREEILKKKICPHFCMIYSWFISTGEDVDFKKLRLIKEQFNKKESKADLNTSLKIIEDYHNALEKQFNDRNAVPLQFNSKNEAVPLIKKNGHAPHFQNHLNSYVIDPYGVIKQKKEMQKDPNINFNEYLNNLKNNLNSSVNRCLLALTEAPNYNLNQWSRKTYESEMIGPVKKMIQTGYHHANEWFSVIFQLLISLQVMYMKKFTFRDMNYESNIFIKDLENNEQTIGYWKYIFDGIEFYVPNHGNLLMIDSNYKDIKNDDRTYAYASKNNTDNDEIFKMVGQAVDEEFNYDDDSGKKTDDGKQLDELQYENLKNLLNPDNFGNKHTNYGGIKPDTKVINLLSSIYNAVMNKKEKNGDLTDIISTYMGMFVHNRTGTPLSSTELESVNLDSPVSRLEKGKLYAYNVRDDLYAWVLFISVSVDGVNCTVLTRNNYKDTDQILKTNVNRNELFEYSSLTAIEQKYKPQETKLSEDELLEIYNVN